jgi:phosphatidylserine decarboxylase
LSQMVHWLTRNRVRWVKNALIDNFVVNFRPDMSEAVQSNPLEFASFNEFFIRTLRADARPQDPDPNALVSPVDGTISQIGALDGSWLVQAKGLAYTLDSLLAGEPAWSAVFQGGSFATLYLAPYNYHRIHMPLPGTLRAAWYIPGALFSVNASTAASVPGLFARNERIVCVFEDGPLQFALVLVGALFVGSMSTVWHGDVTPRSPRRGARLPLDGSLSSLSLARGAELGRFNMGSTVILLLPPGRTAWLPALTAGSTIRVGQALADLT